MLLDTGQLIALQLCKWGVSQSQSGRPTILLNSSTDLLAHEYL